MKRLFVRISQILGYSFKNFVKNKCAFIASSLTFYTVMAIIPFLALCFSIAKGLGLQELFEEGLHQRLKEQQTVANELLPLVYQAIEKTRGGVLGAFGVVVFLWSSRKVILYLENSLDQIWKVSEKSKLKDKYLKYLLVVLIFPLFLIITAFLHILTSRFLSDLLLTEIVDVVLTIIPYVLSWSLFFLLYKYFPRTKVQALSAFIGAVIAGSIFQFLESSYFFFQIGLSRLGGVYGSFAALPLFFVWVQLSWIFLLWGAQLSFVHQNLAYCKIEKKWDSLSYDSYTVLHIWVLAVLWKKQNQLMTFKELSKYTKIPLFPLQKIIHRLQECNLVQKEKKKRISFPEGTEKNTIYELIHKIHSSKMSYLEIKAKEFQTINTNIKKMHQKMKISSANTRLCDFGKKYAR